MLTPPSASQVMPGSVLLMKVVEDFIHLVGDALKAFQSSLIVTDNLGEWLEENGGMASLFGCWEGNRAGWLYTKSTVLEVVSAPIQGP